MSTSLELRPLNPEDPDQVEAAAELWNAACGADLAVSPRMVAYNLQPATGALAAARLAILDGAPAGFVAASTFPADPLVASPDLGWIDAIAVAPAARRMGIGRRLLAWAEAWLARSGCRVVTLGAGLRPFVPGVPVELDSAPAFLRLGYTGEALDAPPEEQTWDVAADLAAYCPPASVHAIDGEARPAQLADVEPLRVFFAREFPGRWRFEFEEHLRGGGRISDYMVLWTARGIDGCCILTFEDSVRPIERFYPYRLSRPWAQLGAIGISADRRGRGYGAVLLDAGLRRLHNNGINGCVIDWTNLVDFYGKFGFTRFRRYLRFYKSL